jgi:hypothetical protein
VTTVRLNPTTVTLLGGLPEKQGTVVGPPATALSDTDVSTYAEVWTARNASSMAQQVAVLSFDAVDFPAGATLTGVEAGAWYSTYLDGGAATRRWGYVLHDAEFTNDQFLGSTDDISRGTPNDESVGVLQEPADLAGWGTNLATVQTKLARPFEAWVMRFSQTDTAVGYQYGLRLYEFFIQLTYDEAPPPPPVKGYGRMKINMGTQEVKNWQYTTDGMPLL